MSRSLKEVGLGNRHLTRSPLVTRDLEILSATPGVSVGFSIPTDNDEVRKVLEPHAPPIGARIGALRKLHEAGIPTWVFIAPILPDEPGPGSMKLLRHISLISWLIH